MESPRIWDLGCHVVTFVISGLIDWREVANAIASRSDESWDGLDHPAPTLEIAHQVSHDRNGRVALWLEAELDRAAHDARQLIGGLKPDEIMERVSDPSFPVSEAASWAWALARDDRPDVQDLSPLVVSQALNLLVRRATLGELNLEIKEQEWPFETLDLSFPDQDFQGK